LAIPPFLDRAGRWFLRSGIQDAGGGVARYYRTDIQRNNPISTEITGYSLSALVYLYSRTERAEYLERAVLAGRFLARAAWDEARACYPFEHGEGARDFAYFFDSGIIVRGLLALWRATREDEYLEAAVRAGRAMARDFADAGCAFHPILTLPDKNPIPRDDRWSRSTGCYQLKSAMAWRDLAEATGDTSFDPPYCALLENSLRTHMSFLPGHPERLKVMDRLHAYSYFLEGMLPCATDPRCVEATRQGIARVAAFLREVGPQFDRSDVYAQLLRARLFADWNGVLPLDREAAAFEAAELAKFQCEDPDPRIDGGFWFGRKGREWLPYVNPVSAGFALQALAMWEQHNEGRAATFRHMLI
jgi:hypothetical protein